MELNASTNEEQERIESGAGDFDEMEDEISTFVVAQVPNVLLSKDDCEFLALHYGDHFVLWKTLENIKHDIGQRMKDGDMSDEASLYEVLEAIQILDKIQQVRQFNTYGGEPVSRYARTLIATR